MGKEFAYNAGDAEHTGSIPGLRRCPGGLLGNPLQCSCLKTLRDTGAWWATVHGAARSRTRPKPCVCFSTAQLDEMVLYVSLGMGVSGSLNNPAVVESQPSPAPFE